MTTQPNPSYQLGDRFQIGNASYTVTQKDRPITSNARKRRRTGVPRTLRMIGVPRIFLPPRI